MNLFLGATWGLNLSPLLYSRCTVIQCRDVKSQIKHTRIAAGIHGNSMVICVVLERAVALTQMTTCRILQKLRSGSGS